MICPQCGQDNVPGARFCVVCGTPLPFSAPVPVRTEPTKAGKFFIACLKALAYFAVYFFAQLIVTVIVVGIVSAAKTMQGIPTDELLLNPIDLLAGRMQLILIISAALTFLTYWIVFAVRGKNVLTEVGVRKVPVPDAVFALLLGLFLNPVVSILLGLIPFPETMIEQYNETISLLVDTEEPFLLDLLGTAIVAPVLEEVVFRGLIFTRLRKGMALAVAFILTCLVFGLVHGNVIQFTYTAVVGALLLWGFLKHESILISIPMHVGFNSAAFLMGMMPENQLLQLSIVFTAAALSLLFGWLLFFRKKAAPEE